MRVALVSLAYPPLSIDGVARQRQVLADGLVERGHDVHVVTLGQNRESILERRVHVHRYPRTEAVNRFLPTLPVLDRPLTDAQLLCEGVLDLADRVALDVVDVPLWLAQPLALVRHAPCPVVVWLQTTVLHLVELQQRDPRPHERVLADIDRHALANAAACIADSHAILADIERLYGVSGLAARTSVVHPGLPDLPSPSARAAALARGRRGLEALVVGRLEQRKGTAMLCEALPRLLAAVPDLMVRLVGRDNSRADGFHREMGHTYPEAFLRAHPALASRVHFDGHVDDATLAQRYETADLLLHPALYESFGLIFLEAMRASLPTVAFASGGALEVFAAGERDGAVLCGAGDVEGLVTEATALLEDSDRRARMGVAARRSFERRFTRERMVCETAAVYARVGARRSRGVGWAAPGNAAGCGGAREVETGCATEPPRGRRAPQEGRLFQVMEALQDRDAVSRIARTNAATLADLGGERPILALFADPRVREETGRLRGMRFHAGDAAIFHYWGFSRLERLFERFPGRKALHYHNITPPTFFAGRSAHYEMTARGYAQLDRIADRFDLVMGDSYYNLDAYAQHLGRAVPMLCVYPQVDAAALRRATCDEAVLARLREERDGPLWLFVGRFAPNKRQDQVMLAFERFVARTGRGQLVFVGDMSALPTFVEQLTRLRGHLRSGSRVRFVPSVSDETLRAYYRAADLFVCASEHEGFCVPLAEAMAYDVPILALDRGAVGETLGGSGLVVREWVPDVVADLAAELLDTPARRRAVVGAQRERLRAFSPSAVRGQLLSAVRFLKDGVESGEVVRIDPTSGRALEARAS